MYRIVIAWWVTVFLVFASCTSTTGQDAAEKSEGEGATETAEEVGPSLPWDYQPYRVLMWVVSDDGKTNAETLDASLRLYLDKHFAAIWHLDIEDAPISIQSAANRQIDQLTYDSISASDPVIAVKRNHEDAVRLRVAANVASIIDKVIASPGRIEELKRRGAEAGNPDLDGVVDRLEAAKGDEVFVKEQWASKGVDAVLVSRGMALTLKEPEAKLINPPINGLVAQAVDQYDKIFIVRVQRRVMPHRIAVVELDTLMRHFGPVAYQSATNQPQLITAIGRAVSLAFAPVVRIDNAGLDNASGLVRAGGLIVDKSSPGYVGVDDVLEPMIRKNDRTGRPIMIGAIDWAFLYVVEPELCALQADKDSGIKVGDEVIGVAGIKIETPQLIARLLKEHAGEVIDVEVNRGDKTQTIKVDLAKTPNALRLQYFGFVGGKTRSGVTTRRVHLKSQAEDLVKPGDRIVSVEGIELETVYEFCRTVVTTRKPFPMKFACSRPDEEMTFSAFECEITPSYLSMKEKRNDQKVEMAFYAGRPGGLQGRKNQRTFRMALKVRPLGDDSMVRLHAKGSPNFPLIGYEIYRKERTSKSMTFVGRTDWDGRIKIDPIDDTLQLLYVKNGGAVLARLPIVPGLTEWEVADIIGDDMRLQAESYIRGVENSIVDLVAVRELFKARIHLRLKKGGKEEFEKAEELLEALRNQPSNERLANDMGKKQDQFVKAIGRNANQRAKVDEMFKRTRDLLSKHVTPQLIKELELDMVNAEANGYRLPDKPDEDE